MIVSVVIPLYNKQNYIARTIQSVIEQTHSLLEIIIVDDGSTDNSIEVVASFNDSRIKLIKQENGGVSKARNKGVENAKADWVAFLDADDEYEDTFIEEVLIFLQNNKDLEMSFIGTNYYLNTKEHTAFPSTIKTGVYDYFQLFGNLRT